MRSRLSFGSSLRKSKNQLADAERA